MCTVPLCDEKRARVDDDESVGVCFSRFMFALAHRDLRTRAYVPSKNFPTIGFRANFHLETRKRRGKFARGGIGVEMGRGGKGGGSFY